jgi:hypothetical protein
MTNRPNATSPQFTIDVNFSFRTTSSYYYQLGIGGPLGSALVWSYAKYKQTTPKRDAEHPARDRTRKAKPSVIVEGSFITKWTTRWAS